MDMWRVQGGQQRYIDAITEGAVWENLPYKGTVKTKIIEMMFVYLKEINTSSKVLNHPMLEFWELGKMEAFLTNFSLVIIDIVGKFGVSRILIDRCNTCCHMKALISKHSMGRQPVYRDIWS